MATLAVRTILVSSLLIVACWVPPLAWAGKPNILFIAIDDLNDWIGVMGGHPQTKTPNIDRLAGMGVVFDNAHCAAPACNPSRAALLWGIRPSTSGVYHNSQPITQAPFLRDKPTLPQWMSRQGYRSIGSGKIFHGGPGNVKFWDHYEQLGGSGNPGPKPANGIPGSGNLDWGPTPEGDEAYGDYKVATYVSRQLTKTHEQPLFLACGIFRPHLPWYVPQKYFDQFPLADIQLPHHLVGDLDDIPEAGRRMANRNDHRRITGADGWKAAVQGYLASIAFCDAQVGRVLDAYEKSPMKENTYIVFWTDHGWSLGEKEHWRKFALWEEPTHTPVIIAGPGIQPGRTHQPVSLLDLFPTICDLAGLEKPAQLEGRSLKPLLENLGVGWDHLAVTTEGRHNHAVRDLRWRYIRYANGSEELYDHKNDPFEHTNLAGRPEFAREKERLARSLPAMNAPDAPYQRGKRRVNPKTNP